MAHKKNTFSLPLSVVSSADVRRLVREISAVDEFLTQAAIRQSGTNVKLPRTSRLLDEAVDANKLNILIEADRKKILTFMTELSQKAPEIHISFGADPSPLFIQKLMTWLRAELNPMILLKVGLEPNIGAGCILRTKNKYFDLSLRQNFKDQRDLLIQGLKGWSS